MRKLEGIVKEIVDEMGYLKKREERFTDTNSACHSHLLPPEPELSLFPSVD